MREKFYGYKAVFCSCTVTFSALSLVAIYNCIMPQILERLDITAAQLGMASTIQTCVSFALSFLAGSVYKKVHASVWLKMTPFAMIVFMLACLYAPSVYLIYLAMILYGVFYTFSCITGTNVIISEWFVEKREEMVSYNQACASIGMAVASFIFSILGRFLSINTTIYVLLALYSVLGIVFMFGIKTPQKMEQLSLGYKDEVGNQDADIVEMQGLEVKEVIKTPTMILLCVALFIGGLALIIGSYATIILTSYGFSAADAALVYTFFSVAGSLGAILMGKIAAKVSTKLYIVIVHVVLEISLIVMYLWGQMEHPAYILAILIFVIIGVGTSGMSVLAPIMLPRLFGMKSFSAVMPIVVGFFTIGIGISGYVMPAIAGKGGWSMAILTAIGLIALCFVGIFLAVSLSPLKKEK